MTKIYMQTLWTLLLMLINKCDFVRTRHVENCNLRASELGPDWYKVQRPIPTGFEDDPDYRKSYIHMPCPDTTVFDKGSCVCTNLLAYIHMSSAGKKQRHGDGIPKMPEIRPLDLIKETVKPPERPKGTRLLNIKTGEVRHCPFRASSHGPQWYLVHEPTETWRPMKCAPGTLFEKRSCTCVHRDVLARAPQKPEDEDIVVLEEEYNDLKKDDTISQSLGISVKDIDFSKKQDNTIPFWRRGSGDTDSKHSVNPTADPAAVLVTLDGQFVTDATIGTFNLGQDKIADEHKKLLTKFGKVPDTPVGLGVKDENSAMILDILDSKKKDQTNQRRTESNRAHLTSTMVARDPASLTDRNHLGMNITAKELAEIGRTIRIIEQQQHTNNGKGKDHMITRSEAFKKTQKRLVMKDEIYFQHRECPKKPLPEHGPQYFQFFVWGLGYIPYTCYGNQIYDHSMCACIPAPAESTVNEINIPIQGCTKEALPEKGPEYFKVYMWGVGLVSYACLGDRVFNQDRCACVPKLNTIDRLPP